MPGAPGSSVEPSWCRRWRANWAIRRTMALRGVSCRVRARGPISKGWPMPPAGCAGAGQGRCFRTSWSIGSTPITGGCPPRSCNKVQRRLWSMPWHRHFPALPGLDWRCLHTWTCAAGKQGARSCDAHAWSVFADEPCDARLWPAFCSAALAGCDRRGNKKPRDARPDARPAVSALQRSLASATRASAMNFCASCGVARLAASWLSTCSMSLDASQASSHSMPAMGPR